MIMLSEQPPGQQGFDMWERNEIGPWAIKHKVTIIQWKTRIKENKLLLWNLKVLGSEAETRNEKMGRKPDT